MTRTASASTRRRSKKSRPTALDLFAGCGGLSSGLSAAGFRVLAAVEKDDDAADSYAANHPNVKLYRADIRKLSPSTLRKELGITKQKPLDLIAGCPPCQGFTRLTESNGRRDRRNQLVRDYLRFVRRLRPKVCMLENVPGLLTRGKLYFRELEKGLEAAGYKVTYKVLELADYGVPQFRKRLVLLAALSGPLDIPEPTHGIPRRAWKTVRETISNLPAPPLRSEVKAGVANRRYEWHYSRDQTNLVRRRLKHTIKNGKDRASLPPSLQLKCHKKQPNGHYDVYGVIDWDSPSPTITSGCTNTSKGRFGHPKAPRPLTATEAALLQTFPRSYRFKGSGLESVARQIGNALPRRFAKVIGKSVIRQLAETAA
jgi:DNA (cytosine-5)-methyltransferase 1